MKKIKKLLMVVLATTLLLALGITASADGGATITIKNATVEKTYNAYKIFNATGTGDKISYSIDSTSPWYSKIILSGSPFETEQVGASTTYNVTIKEGNTVDIIEWINSNKPSDLSANYTKTVASTDNNKVVWESVEEGYYYITSSLGSVVTIDNALGAITIYDKNQKPGWDPENPDDSDDPIDPDVPGYDANKLGKFVKIDEGNYGKTNSASMGDEIDFKINAFAPQYHGDKLVTSYEFTDEFPVGIEYKADSVVLKINGVEIDSSKYTVTLDEKILKVKYDTVGDNAVVTSYPLEAHISITLKATLTTEATYENVNVANMTWLERDPEDTEETPKNPIKDEPGQSKTTTKTYGFNLQKYKDSVADSNKLDGAEFKLYDALTGGSEIKLYMTESGKYRVAVADSEKSDATTIVAGKAEIWGLKAGIYYLEETETPAGYNKLTARKTVDLTNDSTLSTTSGMGNIDVVNKSGTALPSTGGIGTTIFYVVGGVLMLGAVVLLVTKKRMNSKR